jgi:hypothetical protein
MEKKSNGDLEKDVMAHLSGEIVNWSELVINNSYRFRNSKEKVLVAR